MATHATDIADLANATLTRYTRGTLVDLATTLRDFPACKKLMDKNRQIAKPSDGSGKNFSFPVLTSADSNFRFCALYDINNLDQTDGVHLTSIPWRYATTGCHFDVHEISINAEPSKIVDFVKTKETQMEIGFFNGMEAAFWGGPSSSTDDTTFWGLTGYWFVHNASAGFNGGNHTNFSGGPAGLDCTDATYTNWKHYTAQYTANSMPDSVAAIRKAIRSTRFKGIPNKMLKDYSADSQNTIIYTTLDNMLELEDLALGLDDKVGPDLGKYDGMITIARVPLEEAPYLSDNRATSDPYLGVDWDTIGCVYPEGEWSRETPYQQAPNQRNVRQRFRDVSRNFVCVNRRRNFSVAKAAYVSS